MKWKSGGNAQFEKPEPGSHIARCYAVIDLGTQAKTWQGVTHQERQVRISFELPNEKMLGTYDPKSKGKPMMTSRKFKQSLHPKAGLRKFLEGWRGKAFAGEEADNFDPKKLPGLPCRLNLVASEDGQFINIESISPLGKGDKCPKQINPLVFLSLDPEEFNPEVFNALPESTRKTISESPEYKALEAGAPGEEPQEDAPSDPDNGTEPF